MEHKIIFFEGQPGSGKSTLSQYIYGQLKLHNIQVRWIDEYEHDVVYFHDFWEKYESADEDIVSILLNCWNRLLERIKKSGKTILMDSAFFSYTLYLLNLELSKDEIEKYFVELNSILEVLKPCIFLLRGDTETILKRACARRGTAWTSSTINKVEQGPYQISRNRQGVEGLVKYFQDAQSLYLELMPASSFPILQLDVTIEDWKSKQQSVLSWLGYKEIDNHYSIAQDKLNNYCGEYQVPEEFPDKNEELEVVIEEGQLVLKGSYWKDYKMEARSDTNFLIKGMPMELDFKLQEGHIAGFDYTFIDRNTYYCKKVSYEAETKGC